ncbi:glycerophosphodiester phosphodiesterase, periplasmic-like [Epargyreus clarus]|uniref:glycerophosphodiester phosphodiesterase, periplasmic-like n=1 Tax=Epargyreus clarus TaxID=520877 RepID=UPI003C2DB82D
MVTRIFTCRSLVISLSVFLGFATCASENPTRWNPDSCKPIVIAHRGASGYVPEHTSGAYALSITMGSDYVEPDLVMTKDGHLVARHENELTLSTDVAKRPEFANRYSNKIVDGRRVSGWFTEDFTLEELKTLRAVERIPIIRPGNARMDEAFDIPTFQEIIDLVKAMEVSENRKIGIYPELKHGTYFQQIGLAMEQPVVDIFHRNGYRNIEDHAFIQSFEVSNLKQLKQITNLRLIQLFGSRAGQPYDQIVLATGLTYGNMATAEGLKEIATYAHAVGPEKGYIIPRDENNTLGTPTSFVRDAHDAGLLVHPYTFRAENPYLPAEFQGVDSTVSGIGDYSGELRAFIETGIDGLFADQPDVPVRMRECHPTSSGTQLKLLSASVLNLTCIFFILKLL